MPRRGNEMTGEREQGPDQAPDIDFLSENGQGLPLPLPFNPIRAGGRL